jgi:penicillin-binding protein 1A
MQREYQVGDKVWAPRNTGNARYGEPVTLKWGLSQSNNWITAELMYQSDPEGVRLAKYLREFGIANNEIHPSLALCLGTCDITVAEMASAYTAFVNKGIRSAPILVSRIEDTNGTVISEFAPRMNEVISEQSSYKMLDMLRAVVDAGTGIRLRYRYNFTAPIAGKTGTTNSNSDGWLVGCVPRLVTACWVGGEDRDIHFLSTSLGQGASTALPIWATYMKKVYEDSTLGYSQEESFDIDYKMIQQEVDTIMNINFPTAPVVNPETVVEEDDVESYFD